MSFTAHLPGLTIPDILQILSVSRKSGIATIVHSGASAKLVFRAGNVIYASSDTQSRLGYALVQKGLISEEDLKRALAVQQERDDRMPLASVLLKLGIVYPEVLEQETRDHVRRVSRDILSWKNGIFFFEPQELGDTLTVLKQGVKIERLLLEAAAVHDADVGLDREICEFWT